MEKRGTGHYTHEFAPVVDSACRILILGSFPSVKSRAQGFYYGHPQNRFWRVMAAVLAEELPATIDEKRAMLLRNHIALWDVLESCDISGSSDSSITNEVPADIALLLGQSRITRIFTNGAVAGRLYEKYLRKISGIEAQVLPSTSPANAAWSLERLTECWRRNIMTEYTGE